MGNLFELVEKKCPKCGKDSLRLGLLADAKKYGMVEDIHTINICCYEGSCNYDKVIAKRVD